MEKILEVTNLSKVYTSGRGIKDIGFSLNQGDVLALLGPNGAGKTTFLKAITGLVKKNSGQVQLLSHDMDRSYESYVRDIGAMIGTISHLEYLTAIQQLQLKARFFGDSLEELEVLLMKVGLYDYKDETIKGYSTGMKQRLALAYALVGHPKLLLLDEPFSGMDVEGKRQMRFLLKELVTDSGITMIISSHMVGEIESLYTHMAAIQEGTMLDLVSASEIIASGMNLEDFYMSRVDAFHKNIHLSGRRIAI